MPAPAEAAEIAQDIEDSAALLLSLINDLLDISDMEAGQAKLRLTPVLADDLVREVAQAAETMAASKGLASLPIQNPWNSWPTRSGSSRPCSIWWTTR